MARPREFEEEAALDAAVECFWSRGYEGTSVRDLAASMGLAGASLYNAFGGKQALYRRALAHYARRSMRERVARLEGLPPLAALRGFFAEIVARSADDKEARGCMMVNAALDLRADHPEMQAAVTAELAFLEAFFRRQAAAGQADGTITTAQPAEALARMLLSVHLGMRVLARTGPGPAVLAAAADAALALLTRHPSH